MKLLKKILYYKDIAIEKNEEEIKKFKKNLSDKNKELRQMKISLNNYKINKDNQSTLLIKNSQLITKIKEDAGNYIKVNTENNNLITNYIWKLKKFLIK